MGSYEMVKFYYLNVIKITITQANGEGNGHLYLIEVYSSMFLFFRVNLSYDYQNRYGKKKK